MTILTPTLSPMILDDGRGYTGQLKIVRDLANERGGNFPELPEDGEELQSLDERMTSFLQPYAPAAHWVGWHDGSWGVYSDDFEA